MYNFSKQNSANPNSKTIEISASLNPFGMNEFDKIGNNNIEISMQSNKKPISFIQTKII